MIKQLTNILTAAFVLYNVLQAFKASKKDRKLYKRYNKYFMVIAILLVVDSVFSCLLGLIPFYHVFKLLVVVWMSVPACTGAVFAYKFYINEMMKRYEARIDEKVEKIKGMVSGYFNAYYEKAQKKYKEHRGKDEPLGIKDAKAAVERKIEDMAHAEASDSEFSVMDANEGKAEREEWSSRSADDIDEKEGDRVM